MDYINRYNLSFDVKNQRISIELQNRKLVMNNDSDCNLRKIPVTVSESIHIPPYSTRSTPVIAPLSAICSSLIPNRNLCQNKILFNTYESLSFCNYHSMISLSNTSSTSNARLCDSLNPRLSILLHR